MKAVKYIFVFFIIASLQNCIGDDILDDTINEVLSFTNNSLEDGKTQELTIKDSFQYETDFLNNVGKRETPTITWSSSDSDVISITNTGLATALKIGTSTITASVLKDGKPLINKDGEPVINEKEVIVVKAEEKLVIDNLIEDLTINATHQYTTTYTNGLGEIETPQITWSSSDEAIISVSDTGLITAKSVGEVTITALVTVDGKDVTSEDTVTTAGVTERLSIDNPVENLTINTTHQYTTTYTNNLGVVETPQITWSSSDEAIISVSNTGLITAKSIGQATITALATVNGRDITSEDTVTVVGVAERLSIDNQIENLTINTTHQYTTTYTNNLGVVETPQITWSSSDKAIISVSDTGLITAKSIGQATITASVTINGIDDVTSEDIVTVVGVAERLSINNPIENLTINTTHQYTTTYTNSSGVVETPQITWSSSDEAIISVSNTGLITSKSIGQATITASVTINDRDVTSEDDVTTVGIPERLRINNPIENLTINNTHQYTTTYTNNLGVTETPQITWSSSDEAIISVSDTGLITAKSIGQATITALVNVNGRDITSEDDVTIIGIPERLSINNPISELNANNNETHQYTVTYTDETGQTQTPPQITWTSSDTNIATVSNTGLVSAINDQTATTGPVTITATATSSTGQTISDEDTITITITATTQEKTGTIRTTSSYALTGTFTLREISGTNDLELSINADYNASSSLPGLYLYLTNNPNSINNALEIGEVSVFNGAHTYTIPNTGINDYSYLLYWCKPFSVKVGDGEINN